MPCFAYENVTHLPPCQTGFESSSELLTFSAGTDQDAFVQSHICLRMHKPNFRCLHSGTVWFLHCHTHWDFGLNLNCIFHDQSNGTGRTRRPQSVPRFELSSDWWVSCRVWGDEKMFADALLAPVQGFWKR